MMYLAYLVIWLIVVGMINVTGFLYWVHFVPSNEKSFYSENQLKEYVSTPRHETMLMFSIMWPICLPASLPIFVFYLLLDRAFRKISNKEKEDE